VGAARRHIGVSVLGGLKGAPKDPRVRETRLPEFSKGKVPEKTVGDRTPEEGLEEHRLFGPWSEKVLVERPPAESAVAVRVVSERELEFLLFR
jgi:hypothetical protein